MTTEVAFACTREIKHVIDSVTVGYVVYIFHSRPHHRAAVLSTTKAKVVNFPGTQLFEHFLCYPEPHFLKPVPWLVLRPDLSIDGCLSRPNVGFRRLDEFGPLQDLPEYVEGSVDRDTHVAIDSLAYLTRLLIGMEGSGLTLSRNPVYPNWIGRPNA